MILGFYNGAKAVCTQQEPYFEFWSSPGLAGCGTMLGLAQQACAGRLRPPELRECCGHTGRAVRSCDAQQARRTERFFDSTYFQLAMGLSGCNPSKFLQQGRRFSSTFKWRTEASED